MSTISKTTYAMESADEFERLEYQSTFPKYDYKEELRKIEIPNNAKILDAGCGSGVVSRYLSEQHPSAQIVGCDLSEIRMKQAKEKAANYKNVDFRVEDLAGTTFESNTFDIIVSRYVIQHIKPDDRENALSEFFRILKPGGKTVLIDFDGAFHNLYPCSTLVAAGLELMKHSVVDLFIGRKMPAMLGNVGFKNIKWSILTIECKDEILEQEKELIPPKLESASEYFIKTMGSSEKAEEFKKQYLASLNEENVVLFYNKFVVQAQKPLLKQVK